LMAYFFSRDGLLKVDHTHPICAPFLGRCAELEGLSAQALCIGDDPVGGYQCAVDAGLQYFLTDSASLHKNFSG
ncbi:hypothetical protein, partial [Glutamicibacter arilaitensis]|uniref:hypothetical protein n=1 Tax=Glutamicibacter arilaitensis TaxID=256701 RepID=UPI003F91B1CB